MIVPLKLRSTVQNNSACCVCGPAGNHSFPHLCLKTLLAFLCKLLQHNFISAHPTQPNRSVVLMRPGGQSSVWISDQAVFQVMKGGVCSCA